MLVITRLIGESLVIGDDIRITVLDHSPTSAKLGIEAPQTVLVLRSELTPHDDVEVPPGDA